MKSLRGFPVLLFLSAQLHAGDAPFVPVGDPGSVAAAGLHLGFDPLSFTSGSSGGSTPVATASYMHRFASDFDSLPGDVSSHEASILIPVLPLSYDRLRFVAALSYRANWFDTSAPTLLPDDTLHAFRLPTMVLYDLSDRWLLGAMAMPGISGDLGNPGDGFSILSGLGAGYSYSDELKVFAGVLFSAGFDERRFFPGIGVSWKPDPNWSISILPPTASITRRLGEDYYLSLFGRYDGPTWNVEADAAGPDRDIMMREVRVGLRLERRIADHFWAYLAGGASFARRLEIENLSNNSLQEDDIDPGGFLQAGLNVRF